MTKRCMTALYALFLVFLPAQLQAKTPRVDKRISNLFLQNFRNEGFSYIVDPYAQLCFMQTHNGGVIKIDCQALKRRGEWDDVIYWVEPVEKK